VAGHTPRRIVGSIEAGISDPAASQIVLGRAFSHLGALALN
jgi:hypothetical protein